MTGRDKRSGEAATGGTSHQSVPAKDRPSTFSVYARFRRSRLVLARGLQTLEVAEAMLERLRRERLHDPEAVFIVHDRTGEIVTPGSGEAGLDGVRVASRAPIGTMGSALRALREARARYGAALDYALGLVSAIETSQNRDGGETRRLSRQAREANDTLVEHVITTLSHLDAALGSRREP